MNVDVRRLDCGCMTEVGATEGKNLVLIRVEMKMSFSSFEKMRNFAKFHLF
jgi:hypothetical protein